jgi:hypothetical protein
VKVDCLNYYNNTALTNLDATITCQFQVLSYISKEMGQKQAIIELKEINNVQNLLLLFKPIEVAFDEGRISFLWDSSALCRAYL